MNQRQEYHVSMRELQPDDRPRERLVRFGAGALADYELLAIILLNGTRRESVLDLAKRVLSSRVAKEGRSGSEALLALSEATLEELCTVRGIGQAKAVQIKAALELGKRLSGGAPSERSIVRSPEDVSRLVMEDMRFLDREHFRIILLNTKNHVLGVESISVGNLNTTIVHPREIFKIPIKRSAASVILVHNHPSGDPEPSQEDCDITQRLCEAGDLLGIKVLDHVVIGDNRFVSFKERQLM
jgi:DNA repair protein RadC